MINKGTFTLLLIVVLSVPTYSQVEMSTTIVGDSIQKICNEIAADSVFMSESVYYGGWPSEQWPRYQKLLKLSSDTVLFELTNHPTPVVRSYAFLGLLERDSDLLMPAIKKNVNDTITVETQQGCIGGRRPVIVMTTENVYYKYIIDNRGFLNKEDEIYIEEVHKAEMLKRRKIWEQVRKQRNER